MLKLQEYNYKIVHKPGKENVNVDDALSKLPITDQIINTNNDNNNNMKKINKKVNLINTYNEKLRKDQMRKLLYRNLMFYLKENILPDDIKCIKEVTTLSQFFKI